MRKHLAFDCPASMAVITFISMLTFRELVNLQNVNGQIKPYQVRQLLQLIERYNLQMEDKA